jgi:cellulose synthase/poly-beta-1,6-N-acetylglucosamine synthase-like glycosyltransferase
VRISAVQAVGGWNDNALTEDTDITFRLLIRGWKTVYNNAAACYEEVPEEWAVRLRQIHRWAQGHNQVLIRQAWALATSRTVTWRERLDGLLLLNIFLVQPLLLIGWAAAILMYYLNGADALMVFIPGSFLVVLGAVGGLSVFLQMAYGVLLDGNRHRIRLIPLQMFNFIVSLPVISLALWSSVKELFTTNELVWYKTKRYRKVAP